MLHRAVEIVIVRIKNAIEMAPPSASRLATQSAHRVMPGGPVSSRTRKKRRVGQPAPPTPKQQPLPTPRAPSAPTPTKTRATRSRFFDGVGANPGGSTATVKLEDVEQIGEGCGDAGDVAAGARGGGPTGALELAGTPAVAPGSAAQWQQVVGGGSDGGLWGGLWCELGLPAAELRLEQ